MAEARWYVVHTYSGYENKVKVNIEMTVENRGLQDQILEVSVPTETVIETKANGQKKAVERKLFPGYVIVNMVMNDDTWYAVRNIRGVTGFVGPESKPVPLTEAEIKRMGVGRQADAADAIYVTDVKEGDTVTVTGGAWIDTQGVVKVVNANKQTVTIIVDMFGRETPVEIGLNEIKVEK